MALEKVLEAFIKKNPIPPLVEISFGEDKGLLLCKYELFHEMRLCRKAPPLSLK